SPLFEGRVSGERSHRARVWLDTDPDRTGLLPFMWGEDASFERYAQWALDVPMFLVKRDARVVRNTGQTFRAFMRDGFQGAEATLSDWTTHLGTLFPEVRMKKTIEVRGADSASRELVPALPALCKGFLYDAQAREAAEALGERLGGYDQVQAVRSAIAEKGLRAQLAGRSVQAWAGDLLDIARAGLQRLNVVDPVSGRDESVYLEPLEALVVAAQTPADALLAGLDTHQDLVPQVLKLAQL
ncbi:MAG TPA: glutamate-cysteine ligase family protein, partial [Polyangiales bacterium]